MANGVLCQVRRVVTVHCTVIHQMTLTAARASILGWTSTSIPPSQHGPRSRKVDDAPDSGRGRKSGYIGIGEVGCSFAERTGNLLDDKINNLAAIGGFLSPPSWQICACRGSGPHVAEWDCILGRKPRIANQIKSTLLYCTYYSIISLHGPPFFSIATRAVEIDRLDSPR